MNAQEQSAWGTVHFILQLYSGLPMANALVEDALREGPSIGEGSPTDLASWLRKRGLPSVLHHVAELDRDLFAYSASRRQSLVLLYLENYPSAGQGRWAVLLGIAKESADWVVIAADGDPDLPPTLIDGYWTGLAVEVARDIPLGAAVISKRPLPGSAME